MTVQPRLVVSAPSSGHGKTAIAVGLLAACAARGVAASGFKVGPDHTDAAYLGLASGRPGRNLDPRLVGAQRIAPLFAHGATGSQIAVIEGAMGLFDSLTGQPEIDGTAAVAAALRAPVALVVDVASMGHSVAALVHGFRMFDEMVHLGGVILNRVASPRHEQLLRSALDDIGMPVLGALRRGDLPGVLPPRGQGPVPVAHLAVDASRAVRRLGEAVAGALDLDRLMALANAAPALPGPVWSPDEAVGAPGEGERPVIAVAGGPGATYTYVEVAELLAAAGADVAVFDPLRDETLPPGVRGLMIGAGLPEGYAEELSANRRLCTAVARLAHDGAPVIAEGVGLPWLTRDFDGRPMCGVLDASAVTGDRTVAGYREATAPVTSPLAPAGARITGYKQHRAIVSPRAGHVPAWTWAGGNPEGFVHHQVHASQLGLHWAGAPEIARRLVAAAAAHRGAGPGGVGPGAGPVLTGTVVSGPVVTGTVVAGSAVVGSASVGMPVAGGQAMPALGATSPGGMPPGGGHAVPTQGSTSLGGTSPGGGEQETGFAAGSPGRAHAAGVWDAGPGELDAASPGAARDAGYPAERPAYVHDAGPAGYAAEAPGYARDAGPAGYAPEVPGYGRDAGPGSGPDAGSAGPPVEAPGFRHDGASRGYAHAGGPWDAGPGALSRPGGEAAGAVPPGAALPAASPAAGHGAVAPPSPRSAPVPLAGGPLAAVGAGHGAHDTEIEGDGDTADVVPHP
jgi:cobyrinic acid a,c-diamide synthase